MLKIWSPILWSPSIEFIDFVQQWWWRLFQELDGLDWINGGPIIAMQIESNYDSFPKKDPTYLEDLVQLDKDAVFKDGPTFAPQI